MKINRLKLKEYLLKNSIYQYQLAKKLGITESDLSKILRGRLVPNECITERINKAIKKKKVKRPIMIVKYANPRDDRIGSCEDSGEDFLMSLDELEAKKNKETQ